MKGRIHFGSLSGISSSFKSRFNEDKKGGKKKLFPLIFICLFDFALFEATFGIPQLLVLS